MRCLLYTVHLGRAFMCSFRRKTKEQQITPNNGRTGDDALTNVYKKPIKGSFQDWSVK